jgi:prevent-host-death family protein
MPTVNIKQARQKFAQLVESARKGTPVTITRRGKKVAELTAVEGKSAKAMPDMAAFRASLKSGRNGRKTTIADLRRAERA